MLKACKVNKKLTSQEPMTDGARQREEREGQAYYVLAQTAE